MTSPRPRADVTFGPALRALMSEHGMTFRELSDRSRQVDPTNRGLSNSHLVNLAQDRQPPSDRAMELVASVFGIHPEHFVEAQIRSITNRLDLRHNSLHSVLRQLERFDAPARLGPRATWKLA